MEIKKNNVSKSIMDTNVVLARFPQPKELNYTLYTILGKVRTDNNKYVSAIINLNKKLINGNFGKTYNISVLNIYPYSSDPNYISCVINSYITYYRSIAPDKIIIIMCNDGITTSGYYLTKYLQSIYRNPDFVMMMDKMLSAI